VVGLEVNRVAKKKKVRMRMNEESSRAERLAEEYQA
jgi:hypothetical protein